MFKIFKRKRKVLVINPRLSSGSDSKTLASSTSLPIVFDQSIQHSFEVKEVE